MTSPWPHIETSHWPISTSTCFKLLCDTCVPYRHSYCHNRCYVVLPEAPSVVAAEPSRGFLLSSCSSYQLLFPPAGQQIPSLPSATYYCPATSLTNSHSSLQLARTDLFLHLPDYISLLLPSHYPTQTDAPTLPLSIWPAAISTTKPGSPAAPPPTPSSGVEV